MEKLKEDLKISKNNIGNSGEYYIASRLSAEDFIVTITLGRAERYDIIAVNSSGKTFKISVKTRFKADVKRFPLSEKDERGASGDFFYAFVMLNEFKKEPDFWIIPSSVVTKILYESHIDYVENPGKNGQKRKDTGMRNLWMINNTHTKKIYPKNWEIELLSFYRNMKQLK